MILLAAALLQASLGAQPRPLPEVEKQVVLLLNSERARHGLRALQPNDALTAVARAHSADMLHRGFFAHENPDGDGPDDRYARHLRQLIGDGAENVWSGSGYRVDQLAREMVDGWMKSPGHRANILGASTHFGVGIVMAGQEARATTNFADVAAWIEKPVPPVLRRGASLDLTTVPVAGPPPVQFDLWSERTGKRAFGPAPLIGTVIEAPPGPYRLRFLFPSGERRFTIHRGPAIELR